ncbi:hypothetical protein MNBD_BACTEROID03-1765 [hydrothermal vent metagenome]|uniref:Uncharacterized protein n=1 Tax=hydrothermal vent metagenome TaxID=652676 RepID=A0A3B0SX58_9ZZZZ
MIFLFLVLVLAVQWGIYLLLDRSQLPFRRWMVLIVLLIGHLLVFPRLFYLEYDPNGINCGMPILGIHLAFCIFGMPMTLLVHMIYYLNIKKRIKQNP